MKNIASSLLLQLLFATSVHADFEEVDTDFGSVTPTGVVFPSICIGRISVPKIMYTLETADQVAVLSDPPNLVEVGIDPSDGLLYFKFTEEVLDSSSFDAGVIVQFPATELQVISICCGQELQVKDGFTNVQSLAVSDGATAQAVFSSNNVDLEIIVGGEATATVEVNARNSDITVNGSGSGTFVDIAGDITTIVCTDRATCSVAGAISNAEDSSVEGFAVLDTEDCQDITVEGGSTCDESSPFVSANVDGSLTISGVSERCIQGDELDGDFVPAGSPPPTPEGFSPAPSVSPSPTVDRPSLSPVNRPTRNTPAPTLSPTSSGISVVARASRTVLSFAMIVAAGVMTMMMTM
jgi:hypothetical protein